LRRVPNKKNHRAYSAVTKKLSVTHQEALHANDASTYPATFSVFWVPLNYIKALNHVQYSDDEELRRNNTYLRLNYLPEISTSIRRLLAFTNI